MKKTPIRIGSCPTIPFRRIWSHSKLLDKPYKPDFSFKKQAMFKDLVEGTSVTERTKAEILQLVRIQDSFPTIVVIAEIDGFPEWVRSYASEECYLVKAAVRRIVLEAAKRHRVFVWAEWIEPHRLGILIQPLEADQSIHSIDLCDAVREWIAAHSKATVTMGIGDKANGWVGMAVSYKSACSALDYKAALGSNRLILAEDIRSRVQCDRIRQLQLLHVIGQAYRMGNAAWEERFRELFEEMRRHLFSRDELLNMFNYFIHHLHREMSELQEEYREIWKQETLPMLQCTLQEKDTLVQIEACFYDALMRSFERMKVIREGNSNSLLIQKMKGYIEEHFIDQDFSLTYLSDRFGLNSSYLSRLFKEELGETFICYVTRVRIEAAKTLLRETPGSIKEVSWRVGYLNPLTFTRIFKKYTGKTPSTYRKSM